MPALLDPPRRPRAGARPPSTTPLEHASVQAPLPPARPARRMPYKAPGADLRRGQGFRSMLGLTLALACVLGLAHLPVTDTATFVAPVTEQEVVEMQEITPTQQRARPPAPPRPPAPIAVPDDVVIVDEALDLDATLDLDAAPAVLPPPPLPAPEEDAKAEAVEPEVFVVVEEMPTIIGGEERLHELIRYPLMAQKAGMEGLVVVQIVVGTDGVPREPVVARSAGALLDDAAVEAVMQLRFTPGRQRGRAVDVRMAVPIRFRMQSAKSG